MGRPSKALAEHRRQREGAIARAKALRHSELASRIGDEAAQAQEEEESRKWEQSYVVWLIGKRSRRVTTLARATELADSSSQALIAFYDLAEGVKSVVYKKGFLRQGCEEGDSYPVTAYEMRRMAKPVSIHSYPKVPRMPRW